jgi:hypothetical protein
MIWKGCSRERPWTNLRYYAVIMLQGLRKTTKNLNRHSWSRDLNLGPPEYESWALTTPPRRSVRIQGAKLTQENTIRGSPTQGQDSTLGFVPAGFYPLPSLPSTSITSGLFPRAFLPGALPLRTCRLWVRNPWAFTTSGWIIQEEDRDHSQVVWSPMGQGYFRWLCPPRLFPAEPSIPGTKVRRPLSNKLAPWDLAPCATCSKDCSHPSPVLTPIKFPKSNVCPRCHIFFIFMATLQISTPLKWSERYIWNFIVLQRVHISNVSIEGHVVSMKKNFW